MVKTLSKCYFYVESHVFQDRGIRDFIMWYNYKWYTKFASRSSLYIYPIWDKKVPIQTTIVWFEKKIKPKVVKTKSMI